MRRAAPRAAIAAVEHARECTAQGLMGCALCYSAANGAAGWGRERGRGGSEGLGFRVGLHFGPNGAFHAHLARAAAAAALLHAADLNDRMADLFVCLFVCWLVSAVGVFVCLRVGVGRGRFPLLALTHCALRITLACRNRAGRPVASHCIAWRTVLLSSLSSRNVACHRSST